MSSKDRHSRHRIRDTDGSVAIPRGSDVRLVTRRVEVNGDITLDVDSITMAGRRYRVSTSDEELQNRKPGVGGNARTGKYVGGGEVLSAIIGAIAGGGKGAAIGAASGAGAGAATQIITRGKEVHVPAESVIRFRLDSPLRLRLWSCESSRIPTQTGCPVTVFEAGTFAFLFRCQSDRSGPAFSHVRCLHAWPRSGGISRRILDVHISVSFSASLHRCVELLFSAELLPQSIARQRIAEPLSPSLEARFRYGANVRRQFPSRRQYTRNVPGGKGPCTWSFFLYWPL